MVQFIDTHIHLQDFKPDFAPQVLANPLAKKLVLVSAQKSDYVQIADMLEKYPEKLYGAFGVHPWYCHEDWGLDELRAQLKKFEHALVGEIGVDELKAAVSDEQHQFFSAQLKVAQEFSRPIIVHAAKAFNALMEHEKELKNVRYVHHGFVKNNELLNFIKRTDGYIGLGALFLKQEKAHEMWKEIPKNRVLFETDAPYRVSEAKYGDIVEENLHRLAKIAKIDVTELSLQLMANAQEFLKF